MKLASKILSEVRKVVKGKKMTTSDVAEMINAFVKNRRYGVPEKLLAEVGGFYLSGEMTFMSPSGKDYLEIRYDLKPAMAKKMWDDLESNFKHFRVFFDNNEKVNTIIVDGKNIEAFK